MKIIIEPGEAPKVYGNNGQLIKGIFSFEYSYVTSNGYGGGKNTMNLNHYSKPDSKRLSMLHEGWNLDE